MGVAFRVEGAQRGVNLRTWTKLANPRTVSNQPPAVTSITSIGRVSPFLAKLPDLPQTRVFGSRMGIWARKGPRRGGRGGEGVWQGRGLGFGALGV